MNIKLQTNEQLSATVANGLAGVFVNGVSLSASLSGKADVSAIPVNVSQLSNDSGYLTAHQSLSGYYAKSETSSAAEIENALDNVSVDLSEYYAKSETSSSSEISNELKKYQLSGNYLSVNALDDYYQKSETSSASELSTAFENSGGKVYFDNRVSGVTGSNDLSVVKLSADEYAQMLDDGTCLSNAIYIVEAPNIDAFKQQIKNVALPTDLSDAATKEYVDNALTGVQIPTDLSAFTNSPGYLVSNDISGYYKKSETSSAAEISAALSSISSILSGLEDILHEINTGSQS